MGLSDIRRNSSLVVSTVAVVASVGICVTVLLFLRPWPEQRTADAIVSGREIASTELPEPRDKADRQLEPTEEGERLLDERPQSAIAASDSSTRAEEPVEGAALSPAPQERSETETAQTETVQTETAQTEPVRTELVGEKHAALPSPRNDAAEPDHTAAIPKGSGKLTKAEVDQALRPLLSYDLSDNEIRTLKEVIRLVQRDEFAAARAMMGKLDDSGAQKLAAWYFYRAGAYDAAAEEIAAFRASNPLWPNRDALDARVEEALFWREKNAKKVLAFFHERRPVSGPGKAALAGALMAAGKADEGKALLHEAWREHYLTPAIESKIKEQYGDALRPEDHKARLDWLLVKSRKSDLKAIDRVVPLVDKKWEKSTQAQIARIKGEKSAGTLLNKLEGELKSDPAVLLARLQWARRNESDEIVWGLLRAAPTDARKLINSVSWWEHREPHVRYALNAGQAKTAYALAQGHGGSLPAEELSDAEFLAGWIALRFLDDPKAAHKHLLTAAAAGGLPKHRARANYWLGRTELALGNKRGAASRFAESAKHTHTFYGQLARQITEPKAVQLALRPYARPTTSDIKAFTRNDVLKALAAANKAGLDGLVPLFFDDLARAISSAPEMVLLCELASRISKPHQAVRMAKIAMNRGFPVEQYAYPDVLPDFQPLPKGPNLEEALIHALTRQESEFNPTVVSSAGAVGLMQLLPSTAKEVAKSHSVKFEKQKLTSDPSYNLSLGSAFLHRLINGYNGSYIMALAAYNAGPGRVRQWVALFGDPRDKKVDPVDWIERIPFKETREYVFKIMESAQVYRARLDQSSHTLQLAQDLHRGRSGGTRTFLEAGVH